MCCELKYVRGCPFFKKRFAPESVYAIEPRRIESIAKIQSLDDYHIREPLELERELPREDFPIAFPDRGRRLFGGWLFKTMFNHFISKAFLKEDAPGATTLALGAEPADYSKYFKISVEVAAFEAKPIPPTPMAKFKPSDDYDKLAKMYTEKYFDFSSVHAVNRIYMDAPLEASEEYLEMRGAMAPVAIHLDHMAQLKREDPKAYKAVVAGGDFLPMMCPDLEPEFCMEAKDKYRMDFPVYCRKDVEISMMCPGSCGTCGMKF